MLLVDEVDKSDQEFEAFLLEILSDYAITIPELGTFTATVPPLVVLTSNNSRELVAFVQRLRTLELKKLPSVSETIDWARALLLLHVGDLEPEIVRTTLSVLLKYETDIVSANRQLETIVRDVVGRYGTFN